MDIDGNNQATDNSLPTDANWPISPKEDDN